MLTERLWEEKVKHWEQYLAHNKSSINAICWSVVQLTDIKYSSHNNDYSQSVFLLLPRELLCLFLHFSCSSINISSIIYPFNFIWFLLAFILLFICISLPQMSPSKILLPKLVVHHRRTHVWPKGAVDLHSNASVFPPLNSHTLQLWHAIS